MVIHNDTLLEYIICNRINLAHDYAYMINTLANNGKILPKLNSLY